MNNSWRDQIEQAETALATKARYRGKGVGKRGGWDKGVPRGKRGELHVTSGMFVPAHTEADEERVRRQIQHEKDIRRELPAIDFLDQIGIKYPEQHEQNIRKLSNLPTYQLEALRNMVNEGLGKIAQERNLSLRERKGLGSWETNLLWVQRLLNEFER